MTKYFGYKYLVNRSEIIEVYENPLGHFYCLLHTVCVKQSWFQNQSREERTIKITMLCNSIFYTGKKAHQIKQGDGEFILQPYESNNRLHLNFSLLFKNEIICLILFNLGTNYLFSLYQALNFWPKSIFSA